MKSVKSKRPIEWYFETQDCKYLAEDAVFINMNTKEITVGREAICKMLYNLYNVSFNAKSNILNKIVTKEKALLEANFEGQHIGDYAGITATYKNVKVPLCVSYDLENSLIKTARFYFSIETLLNQIK